MSIEAFQKREEIFKIKERLLEVEFARMHGAKDYTIADLDAKLREILGL